MAKMRQMDSKAALGRQRAELRRAARGKQPVGDDMGSAAGRAAEREKVHRMLELQHAREDEAERDMRRRHEEALRQEQLHRPVVALFAELVGDSYRLARTLVLLPFRIASALRGRHPRGVEA